MALRLRSPPACPTEWPALSMPLSSFYATFQIYATFQLFIVGAALFKALKHPDPEVQALPRCVPQKTSPEDGMRSSLKQNDTAFFR